MHWAVFLYPSAASTGAMLHTRNEGRPLSPATSKTCRCAEEGECAEEAAKEEGEEEAGGVSGKVATAARAAVRSQANAANTGATRSGVSGSGKTVMFWWAVEEEDEALPVAAGVDPWAGMGRMAVTVMIRGRDKGTLVSSSDANGDDLLATSNEGERGAAVLDTDTRTGMDDRAVPVALTTGPAAAFAAATAAAAAADGTASGTGWARCVGGRMAGGPTRCGAAANCDAVRHGDTRCGQAAAPSLVGT